VLERAFAYWANVDADIGRRIEDRVRSHQATEPAAGMGEA
jgi:catalase